MTDDKPAAEKEAPLESWKEIASYLNRDVRTVKRWEKSEGLPVHRHQHQARASVYAYPSELEAWKARRKPEPEEVPATSWRRPVPALAMVAALLLALVTAASGPLLNPPGAAAADGGGLVARQVWTGPEVELHGVPSPDGRYLPHTDWETGDLALHDFVSGENRRLTHKGSWDESSEFAHAAVPSPDGRQIAYGWFNKDFFYELRVIGLDASEPRVLYRNEEMAYVQPEGWSPDGKQILMQLTRKDGANQLGWINVADGSAKVLKTMDWRYPFKVGLSPDGRYIAYDFAPEESSPQRDIFLLAADGGREIPLVRDPANDVLLGWAPDSRRLLFASDRTGTMDAWIIAVSDGKPEGPPQLVKKDIGHIRPLGLTRKGSFFYAVSAGMNDVYLAALDPATGTLLAEPVKVSEHRVGSNSLPDWSPDGDYLAYVSQPPDAHFSTGPDARVILRSVKTGEERELWPQLNHISSLEWTHDGQSLLLTGYDRNRIYNQSIYRMDPHTGQVTPIVRSRYEGSIYEVVSSLDGKTIFFHRDDLETKGCRFFIRDLQTGKEKELMRALRPSYAGHLALSPDGRQLAFLRWDTGRQSLMLMPAQGGDTRVLLHVESKSERLLDLAWTPDGRWLLFTKTPDSPDAPAILWRISAQGGEPEALGLSFPHLRNMRVHRDGRQIVFTAGQPFKNEIWALENFLPEAKPAR